MLSASSVPHCGQRCKSCGCFAPWGVVVSTKSTTGKVSREQTGHCGLWSTVRHCGQSRSPDVRQLSRPAARVDVAHVAAAVEVGLVDLAGVVGELAVALVAQGQPAAVAALSADVGRQPAARGAQRDIVAPEEGRLVADLAHQAAHFADPELDLQGQERSGGVGDVERCEGGGCRTEVSFGFLDAGGGDEGQEGLEEQVLGFGGMGSEVRVPAGQAREEVVQGQEGVAGGGQERGEEAVGAQGCGQLEWIQRGAKPLKRIGARCSRRSSRRFARAARRSRRAGRNGWPARAGTRPGPAAPRR